ncbi:MAG: hypothetical protein AB7G76_05215 [Steroidobacteraceae bacterium]|uniref:hypothetical protein n=1 Tax=Alcaligenes sp. SMD-FA TaxID=2991054 RepID=UPI002226DC21|nr:hypothetical protein [Alcaligenes sp. SMD-FA]UYY86324.1 hypothetical protein OKX01_13555 [Alcaligenes sp. SMD-FA]
MLTDEEYAVMKIHPDVGDALFRRNCGGGFHQEAAPEGLLVQPEGTSGAPADLESELDIALIGRTLDPTASALLMIDTEP